MSDTERSHRLFSGHDGAVWAYIDYDNGRAVRLRMLNQSNKPLTVTIRLPEGVGAGSSHTLPPHNLKETHKTLVRAMDDGTTKTAKVLTRYEAAKEVAFPLDFPVQAEGRGLKGFTVEVELG
jgi:hypothetical protein